LDAAAALLGRSTRKDAPTTTLRALTQALLTAGGSSEAQLWEFRCVMAASGVRHREVHKCFELASKPMFRGRDRRRRVEPFAVDFGANSADPDGTSSHALVGPDGLPPQRSRHLECPMWLRFCLALDFSAAEAERLFGIFDGSEDLGVDLDRMFELLRTKFAPDCSLERFAAKVLSAYSSIDEAFEAFCEPNGSLIRFGEFYKLCAALDLNDDNIQRLWRVLCEAQDRVGVPDLGLQTLQDHERLWGDQEADSQVTKGLAVTKAVFVRQLEDWAPDTALGVLRNQIYDRYESLKECWTVVDKKGISRSSTLSIQKLDEILQAIDVTGCDASRVLAALETEQRTRTQAPSLGQLIDSLELTDSNGVNRGYDLIKDGTSLAWRRLQAVQSELVDTSERPVRNSKSATKTPSLSDLRKTYSLKRIPQPRSEGSQDWPACNLPLPDVTLASISLATSLAALGA